MISGKELYHMPVQLLVSKFLAAPSSEVIKTFHGGFGVGPEARLDSVDEAESFHERSWM